MVIVTVNTAKDRIPSQSLHLRPKGSFVFIRKLGVLCKFVLKVGKHHSKHAGSTEALSLLSKDIRSAVTEP